jgi:hypothetical protein
MESVPDAVIQVNTVVLTSQHGHLSFATPPPCMRNTAVFKRKHRRVAIDVYFMQQSKD